MIGQVLGERYEIIERIGGGGMALVFKGRDVLLHRKVAVKVLRQQYVNDEEFIRRFRREAQAAASLSHPNVVNIYDVGQAGDIYYIVMEYIEGTNLNELIKEKAPLQVEEAVHIASQICDALDHAHHNQIIHRDIKPHNILIGRNGRVKVTDFGIARAVASSTITSTGSVVGSVHYFSPEHAKGVSTGAKSDLYSLGIVMYQMLTAKLPFLGDSPISVALKHLQEDVEEPRKLNPTIPQSVENIILRAMRKNPEERYASAKAMIEDLDTCLLPERLGEPKLAGGRDEEEDEERTLVIPAIREMSRDSADADGEEPASRSGKGAAGRKKRRIWIKPLVWTAVLASMLLVMWYGIGVLQDYIKVPEVEVPHVVGMTEEEALEALKEVQLVGNVDYENHPVVEKGVVISQDRSGIRSKVNSIVRLSVSLGTESALMPSLANMQWRQVELELIALGFTSEQIAGFREDIFANEAAGTVIHQEPRAGEAIDADNPNIKITVSKGLETKPMPNLINQSLQSAQQRLRVENLNLPEENIIYEPHYSVARGNVFRQHPFEPGDDVEPGSDIILYVSSGLPEDALTSTVSVTVRPEQNGQESEVKIFISDARGDNIEWVTRKITSLQTFDVSLVLSPQKDGVVRIVRDGRNIDVQTQTYEQVRRQQGNASGGSGSGNAGANEDTRTESGGEGPASPGIPLGSILGSLFGGRG